MLKLIRNTLMLAVALVATTSLFAQEVLWKSRVEQLDGEHYRVLLEASIPDSFHMYDMGPYQNGPTATTIHFSPSEGVTLVGGVEPLSKPHRYFDEMFGMEIGTYDGKVQFAQNVKLAAPQATLKAEIEWMICDEKNCIPPQDIELTIQLPEGATPTATPATSTPQIAVTPLETATEQPTEAKPSRSGR